MSYDIYCYKPSSEKPSIDEAQAIVENKVVSASEMNEQEEIKKRIANSLMVFNPKLERFEFDYDEIARLKKISVADAKRQYNHIELNTPEEDSAIQIEVNIDHVSISTPYWYEGDDAKNIFGEISEYLKIIKKEAGYFVYDPQNETAFDPEVHEFDNLESYENIVTKMPEIAYNTMKNWKKPWWKFW